MEKMCETGGRATVHPEITRFKVNKYLCVVMYNKLLFVLRFVNIQLLLAFFNFS